MQCTRAVGSSSLRCAGAVRPFAAATRTRAVQTAAQTKQRASSSSARAQQRSADDEELDLGALGKYAGSWALQTSLMTGALFLLNQYCAAVQAAELPFGWQAEDAQAAVVGTFFLTMAFRSRLFCPLPAERPKTSYIRELNRPPWTPPGPTFPIVWTLINLLRTTSSLVVWEACGRDTLALPLVVMMAHLAVGDVWNFITNREKRLGVSASGMVFTVGSAWALVAAYNSVSDMAGGLILPSALWISIASTIVVGTYTLNPVDEQTGELAPLYPSKGESRLAAEYEAAARS